MATIDNKELNKIKEYYKKGLSVREISDKIGVSMDAVFYFFRKNKIPRRSPAENNNLRFSKKLPSFKIKENLTVKEKELKTAGIMLYWGEGSKWDGEKIVDFANSDEKMIIVFLRFLREVCGIEEKKLRVYLYCYANQKPQELIKFWSKITRIPVKNFYKPYVKQDFKVAKSGKMKNGLIHIRYNDKKLLILIKKWINDFVDKNCK